MSWNTHIPKFRRFVLQNFPFIEEDFDALTDYALICKVVEYLNAVINSQNEVVAEVESFETNITNGFNRLEGLFNELKSYVDNYFDNLDVQDKINNKLEAMADDGTLQEIVGSYLNATALWGFDTVADLKSSTNLIAGSYARTLGFHSKGDMGSATYKIREITVDDTVDEMTIISLGRDNLVAELVEPMVVNPEIFGAYGDGTHDDTVAVQKAFTYKNVKMTKSYLISNTLEFKDKEYFYLDAKTSTITYTNSLYAVLLQHLRFGTLEFGNITASNGSGIYLNSVVGTADRIAYINLSFNKLSCQETNIGVNIENEGFINEVNVTGGQISSGDYGFHFVNSNTVASGCNAWRINHVGFEGCDTCFYYNASNAGRFYGHEIKNSRYIEHVTSTILHVIGAFYRCTFESWGLLKMSRLNLDSANLTDFDFKGYIYDEAGTNLLYTGFYESSGVRTYYNNRYFKETLTTNTNLTSGGVTVHKNGNLVIVRFGSIVMSGTTTLTIVDENGNPYAPKSSSFIGNVSGVLMSTDGSTAAYAIVRANGSIAVKCTDATKTYMGEVSYFTDVRG